MWSDSERDRSANGAFCELQYLECFFLSSRVVQYRTARRSSSLDVPNSSDTRREGHQMRAAMNVARTSHGLEGRLQKEKWSERKR